MKLDDVVIKRLTEQDSQQAYCCMTEVPTPWVDSLCVCRDWVSQNLHRYVEGYHALVNDRIVGHLYYAPSERALFAYDAEPGATVIYCEWVQRHYQGHGVAHKLFDTFVADLRNQSSKGILVECTDSESMMACHHYTVRGFQILHPSQHRKLLYLPLSQSSIKAQPLVPSIAVRRGMPIEILVLSGYLCPVDVSTQVQLIDIAREFGDQVVMRQERLTPETLRHFGTASGIFINGKQKLFGATTDQAIRQAIAEEL
ncbi:MAG: GNAT family N-acetyltransferase [Chloroflexi bacterium]|nr:GNAT family N-acetyltransferase [Chloroflexota bacterium]